MLFAKRMGEMENKLGDTLINYYLLGNHIANFLHHPQHLC